MRKSFLIGGVALGMGVNCGGGFLVGMFTGEESMRNTRYVEEHDLIAPILASDPAFSRVIIQRYSGGGIYLSGAVKTHDDWKRLRAAAARQVGEPRANKWMGYVLEEDSIGGPRQ